jgi:drug/metabolite transporter (DMT)-like permease
MLISLAGILVILSRGEMRNLLRLEVHAGDAWILLAMPVWGVYSVILKRRPPELSGTGFLFVISALGMLMLASALAFMCWNRGVTVVGANAAGFTLHLLPAFGTLLAILFLGESLGESFGGYRAAGIATIVAGVILAARPASTAQPGRPGSPRSRLGSRSP